MTVEIKLKCDGSGCCSCIELDGHSLDCNCEYIIPDNWDTIDGYHYCSICTKRILESGELEV